MAQRGSCEADFVAHLTERGSLGTTPSWSGGLRMEDVTDDPRGQCSGTAAQGHEPSSGNGQRRRSLPAVRDLAHPVLPLAPALSGVRRRGTSATADATAALGPTGGTGARARGAGVRAAVADLRPAADRGSSRPAQVRRLEGQCLGSLRGPAPSRSANALGAADPARAASDAGRAAHRTNPASAARRAERRRGARRGQAAGRPGLPRHVLRRPAQGGSAKSGSTPRATRPARSRSPCSRPATTLRWRRGS